MNFEEKMLKQVEDKSYEDIDSLDMTEEVDEGSLGSDVACLDDMTPSDASRLIRDHNAIVAEINSGS